MSWQTRSKTTGGEIRQSMFSTAYALVADVSKKTLTINWAATSPQPNLKYPATQIEPSFSATLQTAATVDLTTPVNHLQQQSTCVVGITHLCYQNLVVILSQPSRILVLIQYKGA